MTGQNDIFLNGVRKKWNMRNITKHIEWLNKDLEKPHKRGKIRSAHWTVQWMFYSFRGKNGGYALVEEQ